MTSAWDTIRHCLGEIPGDFHENHLATCQKYTFLGPTPDLVNQKLWVRGPAICVLSIPMQANV